MKKSQKIVAAILFVAHAFCWFTQTEFWPFSPYPMYSNKYKQDPEEFKNFQLNAVSPSGEETKFPIVRYLYPFWHSAFFESFYTREPKENQILFLETMAALYSERKKIQSDSWPEVKSFRLYRTYFSWSSLEEKQKSGQSAQEISPDRKVLLFEVPLK